MPARPDQPAGDPADQPSPGPRSAPPGSRDDLMRRLAALPANHPSSPWQRDRAARPDGGSGAGRAWDAARAREEPGAGRGQDTSLAREQSAEEAGSSRAGRPGTTGAGRPGEPGAESRGSGAGGSERPGESGQHRQGKSGSGVPGRDAARKPGGEAAAIAARALRGGEPKEAREEKNRSGLLSDDRLNSLAARQHAAAQARRETRRRASPGAPGPGDREPLRPWFADRADEELWLNSGQTGDPWFAPDEWSRDA